jgi:hypothetical protein
MDIMDGIEVRGGPSIECSVVAERRKPLSFSGMMCRGEDQELKKWHALPSHSMASNSDLAIVSQSGASHCGRQVTAGPGIDRM